MQYPPPTCAEAKDKRISKVCSVSTNKCIYRSRGTPLRDIQSDAQEILATRQLGSWAPSGIRAVWIGS